jgi:1,2-phenylacetyl-CoA epoxidase PaaB subunit
MLDKIDRTRGHIKNIDAQLLKTLGMAKAPLAYIIRENMAVRPHQAGRPSGWLHHGAGRVGCMNAPHSYVYREDNIAIWDVIRDSISILLGQEVGETLQWIGSLHCLDVTLLR